MSEDASPSSPAQTDPSSIDPTGTRLGWDGVPNSSRRRTRSQSQSHSHSHSQRRRKKKSRKKRNPGLSKKLEFVTHLLKSLDTLVFAELIGQYMYLTPKDESFPFLMPASRMHVMLVVIPNLICMLLHLFCALPVGPEYHRGYMHGGLVIDFVGQKPPTSRLYYILADLAILAIQSLMLTVHSERERLRVMLKTFRPLVSDLAREAMSIPTIEDLDAEERGISREMTASTTGTNETNDIEMQPLRRASDREESSERNGDAESVSRESSSMEESSRSHLSDLLSSGNAILGEYHIIHSIRSAAMDLERTAAHSLRSLSYGATIALEARRRGANVTTRAVQTDRR